MNRTRLNRIAIMLALTGAIAPVVLAQNVDPSKDAKVKADAAAAQAKKAAQDAEKAAKDAMEKAKAGQPPAMPEMSPEEAEMMKAWEAAATPGDHHKHLEVMAGEFEGTNTWWMAAGAPPNVSPMKCSGRMELEGRYLITHHKGDMMGMQFHGIGTMGYNNTTKQYESAWMDNMGTMTMFMTGTCSEDGKVFKMEGKFMDPTGKPSYMKETCTVVDADTFRYDMYGPGMDGKEFKMMEIVYKRKK